MFVNSLANIMAFSSMAVVEYDLGLYCAHCVEAEREEMEFTSPASGAGITDRSRPQEGKEQVMMLERAENTV